MVAFITADRMVSLSPYYSNCHLCSAKEACGCENIVTQNTHSFSFQDRNHQKYATPQRRVVIVTGMGQGLDIS